MLLYIISYHLDVICFSEQIVWHVHMCMCVYVHISTQVNLLWQGTFPCYNKEHELDLNLKSNYYSHAFIIGSTGNRLQSVSVALKQLQIISIWKSSCSAVSTLTFGQSLSKVCASFYFPLKSWPYSISGFPFLMDLMQVPQWWSLNPRHFQWVWHLPGLRDRSVAPAEDIFWAQCVTVTGPCLNSTWGIPELSKDQEHIQLQGKSHNYHSVFAKGLVGESQELRKCNCV